MSAQTPLDRKNNHERAELKRRFEEDKLQRQKRLNDYQNQQQAASFQDQLMNLGKNLKSAKTGKPLSPLEALKQLSQAFKVDDAQMQSEGHLQSEGHPNFGDVIFKLIALILDSLIYALEDAKPSPNKNMLNQYSNACAMDKSSSCRSDAETRHVKRPISA